MIIRNLAREMIAYQTDGFRLKLIKEFEKLQSFDNALDALGTAERIDAMVLARTGVRSKLLIDNDIAPCALPTVLNNCHVFRNSENIGEYSPENLNKIINDKGSFKGTIDIKNARLSGDYSKIEAPIAIGFSIIKNMDAAAIAGIYVHEVGHLWTFLATSWRTHRSSMFLAQMLSAQTQPNVNDYSMIVAKIGKAMVSEGLVAKEDEITSMTEMKRDASQVAYFTSRVWNKASSDFGNFTSSMHNAESQADSFSVRFGFARDLVDALMPSGVRVKVKPAGDYYQSFFVTIVQSVVGGAVLGASGGLLVATGVGLAIGTVLMMLGISFSGFNSLSSGQLENYGNDVDRVNRMRLNLIDVMKDHTISKDIRRDVMEQEKYLTETMKYIKNSQTFFDALADMVKSKGRAARAAVELEVQLEKLASNNLFVAGNRLASL